MIVCKCDFCSNETETRNTERLVFVNQFHVQQKRAMCNSCVEKLDKFLSKLQKVKA